MSTKETAEYWNRVDMRLHSLELKNFKGVRSYVLSLNGESAVIFGENETGKSTLIDAFYYLLFEKNALDQSIQKFAFQTLDEQGNIIHHLEHSVKGEFSVPDSLNSSGSLTLERCVTEKWTKTRGSEKPTRRGTETEYTFDGEPVSQTEFNRRMEEIAPVNVFKMLTNIHYFSMQMDWQDRRKVLFDLAGDIKDEEVIASNLDLAKYPKILDGKTQDARVNILKKVKKELSEDIKGIPERIDENELGIEPVDKTDLGEARNTILAKEKAIDSILDKIAGLNSGGFSGEIKGELAELDAQELRLKSNHSQSIEEATGEARRSIGIAKDEKHEAIELVSSKIRELALQRTELLEEHAEKEAKKNAEKKEVERIEGLISETRAKEPKPKVCDLCDRPFENVEGDTSHDDYIAKFNEEKAQALKLADEKLDQAVLALEKAEQELENVTSTGQGIAKEIENLEKERKEVTGLHDKRIKDAQQAYDDLLEEQPNVEDSEEYKDILKKREELENKLENHQQEKQAQVQRLEEKKDEIKKEISDARDVLVVHERNESLSKRNNELRELLAEKSRRLDEVEADLTTIEKFITAQSRFVTEKVNGMFKHVSFKLFEYQNNGGVKETCEVLGKNGVGYTLGLNSAQQVQIGMEIIEVLGNHYGLTLPVFIDNRESVTELPETNLQVISLVVSPGDKKLRVETSNKEALVA